MANPHRREETPFPPHRIEEVLTDSHAHIHFPQFEGEQSDVLKRARDENVRWIVEVGCGEGEKSFERARDIAHSFEGVYYSVGVHPHEVAGASHEVIDKIKDFVNDPLCVAIGETGLDYAKEYSPRDVQKEWFIKFLHLSGELRKPLIVHIREAMEDALEILERERGHYIGGVFHCFSGNVEQARKALELGFLISVSGTVTFKNAKKIIEVVEELPLEAFLIETDSPFLSPVPFRGKRNEPARVKFVAEKIAEIKGLSVEDVMRVTNLNFHRVFNIPFINEPKIAYRIRNSLYLNITNRCTNACVFCGKFKSWYVKGHYLKLDKEPSVEEIIEAVGDPTRYDEVVFCGYGEPLLRPEVVKKVSETLKEKGARKIRIDTDGLANAVHGRSIPEYLKGLVDVYSVSLNAPDADTYRRLCRPPQGIDAFNALIEFVEDAKRFADVIVSIVDIPGALDKEKVEELSRKLGVPLRVRKYNDLG